MSVGAPRPPLRLATAADVSALAALYEDNEVDHRNRQHQDQQQHQYIQLALASLLE